MKNPISILEIPIYKISPIDFKSRFNKLLVKRKEEYSLNRSEYEAVEMAHESTLEFREWKFNQQIGFIDVVLHRHDVIFNTYLPINTKNIWTFTHKMKYVQLQHYSGLHFQINGLKDNDIKREYNNLIDMITNDQFKHFYLDLSGINANIFLFLLKYKTNSLH
jgi:hypothetical protein